MRMIVLCLIGVLLAGCEQAVTLPSPFNAANVGQQFTEVNFELRDQHGKLRRLSEFKGKVVAVFFGYTHCPDVCPTTLADLAQVKKELGKQAKNFQVLFITVDPERDTPARLRDYIQGFESDFVALEGDASQLAAVAAQFGVTYSKQPLERGYYVDHTTGTFLLDGRGKIRLHAPYQQTAADLVADIRLLLNGA